MKKIEFVKINPTQNMTILVKTPVERKLHQAYAEQILDYGHLFGEQVGYIEAPEDARAVARLQMMGGEFCGNATMSLAAYLLWKKNLPIGSTEEILLEVSGADKLLSCKVEVTESGLRGRVKMPSAIGVKTVHLSFEGREILAHKVTMPGINHYIVPKEAVDLSKEKALEALLYSLGKEADVEALGLMFWDEKEKQMTPLVYVIPTNTIIWERGCGSGSAALGAFLSKDLKSGEASYHIAQPGGIITVTANPEGDLWIEGLVRIVAEGAAYLL